MNARARAATILGTLAANEVRHASRGLGKRIRNDIYGMLYNPAKRRLLGTTNRRRKSGPRFRISYSGRPSKYGRRRTSTQRNRYRRAMGTTGPAARTRLRKTRYNSQLGEKIGHHPSRKFNFTGKNVNIRDKELHTTRLVKVPWSDSDDLMDVRKGELCDIIGVKFRAWFQIKPQLIDASSAFKQPLQVRWAILNPKTNIGNVTDITNGQDFFMDPAPSTDIAENFATTGKAFTFMNRKINRRAYGVLQEGTFILENDTASNQNRRSVGSRKFISTWVPIGRQMKFEFNTSDDASSFPSQNLHFVFWYCRQGDPNTARAFPTTNDAAIEFDHECITYFRNANILM